MGGVKDKIVIEGITDASDVSYDADTNIITGGGYTIAQSGDNITITQDGADAPAQTITFDNSALNDAAVVAMQQLALQIQQNG